MNKKLVVMSLASVMALVNQGLAAEVIEVNAADVMERCDANDSTIMLKGINIDRLSLREGKTIELTIPRKIDGKQVELAPRAFYKLNMKGAFLKLKFEDGVKFPSNCSEMFAGRFNDKSPIRHIDFGKVDTSNVDDMSLMFVRCRGLTSLDLSGFSTKNVKNMGSMFCSCANLTSLDLSNFNTENVEYMRYMFDGCNSLTSLNLSSFNTKNVRYINNMFNGCNSLTSLNLSNFNTTNVKSMHRMFNGCNSLISLFLSNFNMENVRYIDNMFNECNSLVRHNIAKII